MDQWALAFGQITFHAWILHWSQNRGITPGVIFDSVHPRRSERFEKSRTELPDWRARDPSNSRPNFGGLWKLNVRKSVFRSAVPEQVLLRIEHRKPMLEQQVCVMRADGAERRQNFRCEAGSEVTNSIGGAAARTTARGDGRQLVIESWVETPEGKFHFEDHWRLSNDGSILTMAHRDDDLAGQISVLERASVAEAALFGVR